MSIIYIVSLAVYFILLVVWGIAAMQGAQFQEYIEPLDRKEYKLKDFYAVGFSLLKWCRYSFMSNMDRKRIGQCGIIYGDKYGEYYYRINMAQKITYTFSFITLSFLLFPLTGSPIGFGAGIAAAAVSWWYIDDKITSIIKEREDTIGKDFPDMLSKMALLINAGMIMREAWETVGRTGGNALIYREMRLASEEMANGTPEIDAYIGFGNRCGTASVKKFVSLLVQNLTKGNSELVAFLKQATATSWEEKKTIVRIQGEKAGNKLLIPIGMIFCGILIMILVPIVSQLGI